MYFRVRRRRNKTHPDATYISPRHSTPSSTSLLNSQFAVPARGSITSLTFVCSATNLSSFSIISTSLRSSMTKILRRHFSRVPRPGYQSIVTLSCVCQTRLNLRKSAMLLSLETRRLTNPSCMPTHPLRLRMPEAHTAVKNELLGNRLVTGGKSYRVRVRERVCTGYGQRSRSQRSGARPRSPNRYRYRYRVRNRLLRPRSGSRRQV